MRVVRRDDDVTTAKTYARRISTDARAIADATARRALARTSLDRATIIVVMTIVLTTIVDHDRGSMKERSEAHALESGWPSSSLQSSARALATRHSRPAVGRRNRRGSVGPRRYESAMKRNDATTSREKIIRCPALGHDRAHRPW